MFCRLTYGDSRRERAHENVRNNVSLMLLHCSRVLRIG
ncbi:hypothetical protein GLA29479_1173 [Lysobacter antibioticus]|nr:hypothetical protein GLA29479_1173 [Lysobacter antibioticus]